MGAIKEVHNLSFSLPLPSSTSSEATGQTVVVMMTTGFAVPADNSLRRRTNGVLKGETSIQVHSGDEILFIRLFVSSVSLSCETRKNKRKYASKGSRGRSDCAFPLCVLLNYTISLAPPASGGSGSGSDDHHHHDCNVGAVA